TAWYPPGIAHFLSSRAHPAADHSPFQAMVTSAGWARRTTTSWLPSTLPQCWLDHTRSLPEVIFSTTVRWETTKVQASRSVVSSSGMAISGLPAGALLKVAATLTSAGSQGPSGDARTTFGFLRFFGCFCAGGSDL